LFVEGANVVETTISRRSSSGVGSISTRSEDDLFADAVTDFVDSPGVGGASDGIGLRKNSLQKIPENDPDRTKLPAVNAINGKPLLCLVLPLCCHVLYNFFFWLDLSLMCSWLSSDLSLSYHLEQWSLIK